MMLSEVMKHTKMDEIVPTQYEEWILRVMEMESTLLEAHTSISKYDNVIVHPTVAKMETAFKEHNTRLVQQNQQLHRLSQMWQDNANNATAKLTGVVDKLKLLEAQLNGATKGD